MDSQSNKSQIYLEKIQQELAILKDNTLANCETTVQQSEKIYSMENKSKQIHTNVKVSRWYLNLINATFGKLYSKIHKIPELKFKRSKKKMEPNKNNKSRKNNKIHKNSVTNMTNVTSNKQPIYDSISNTLNEVHEMNIVINNEISKHNELLGNITNVTENSTDLLVSNIHKAKRMIKKI